MGASRPETARPSGGSGGSVINGATAVAWLGHGLLLLGPSGSGKSDFALRIVEGGGRLVADDMVRLVAKDGTLLARPYALPGHIELRGLGVYDIAGEADAEVALTLAVRLVSPAEAATIPRLPPIARTTVQGVDLPEIMLDPRQPSATARLRVVLTGRRVDV